ncbi:hypothetical protein [Paenibacillus xylanexedens]|uniref:hypothetical protein n=1 Tax=Paenibacillus xylanexedens TaxID=528191 RepID=UPI000F524828|nr:hypothetical protein [Paenibacillus xylanexedens]RPK19998.1 hypothetical protein EDO6_06515 [Paenibacillus xylanexedens]
MLKIKYLITLVLLVTVLAGCGEKKALTDEEYFQQTNEAVADTLDTVDNMMDNVSIFTKDNSKYTQMAEPAQKDYDTFTDTYEQFSEIQPVAGWEERHEEMLTELKFFQDYAREVVRTSKDGNSHDLGVLSSKFMHHIRELNRLVELYQAKG